MLKRILVPAFALVALLFGVVAQATAETLVALTGQPGFSRLLTFDSASPGTISNNVQVSGLQANEILLGIDYRPANGQLYGLTNQSRIYTINPLTGVATLASTLSTPTLAPVDNFGVDFDPVTDRLRLVSNRASQNLRVNVDTGEVIADTSFDPVLSITAAAYTNNFAGATETTLYELDLGHVSSRNPGYLVIHNPPGGGTVTDVGPLRVLGSFAFNVLTGFDISGQTGIAYAAIQFGGTDAFHKLYTINLATGRSSLVGQIGSGFAIFGLAAPIGGTPEPIRVVLSRDSGGQLQATITITNPLPTPVVDVQMTSVRASTLDGSAFVDGVPVPQSFGTVNPGQSVTATVTFPGTASVPAGFSGLVRVDLSYTGGTYNETKQVVTP